jgi:TusA-related sulfurtransferase
MESSTGCFILCIMRSTTSLETIGLDKARYGMSRHRLRKAAVMNSDPNQPPPNPDALLEFYQTSGNSGPTCALLTPAIKEKLRGMASGQVLEVRVDDPAAREDILSWSRLSGHEVLAMRSEEPQRLQFFLKKK